MTDQYLSRALQELREEKVRLEAEQEQKKGELREAQRALRGVCKAIAALDPDSQASGGVSAEDLREEMERALQAKPSIDNSSLREHMKTCVRESGRSLRGFRTSFDKALRLARAASGSEGAE